MDAHGARAPRKGSYSPRQDPQRGTSCTRAHAPCVGSTNEPTRGGALLVPLRFPQRHRDSAPVPSTPGRQQSPVLGRAYLAEARGAPLRACGCARKHDRLRELGPRSRAPPPEKTLIPRENGEPTSTPTGCPRLETALCPGGLCTVGRTRNPCRYAPDVERPSVGGSPRLTSPSHEGSP